MKVLQINSVIDYGSTGRISRNLYDTLVKNGHDSVIAFGRGSSTKGYKTIKIGNKLDQFIHLLYSRLSDRHGFGSYFATKKIIREIDKFEPDIIHLHNLHGYYLNIKILFKYLSKKNLPIIWLMHDQWAISGHSANFDLDEDGNIPTKLINKDELKKYPKTIGVSQFKRNLKEKELLINSLDNLTIVTPSNWLNEILSRSFLSKHDILTIHNGINTDLFQIDHTNSVKLRNEWNATNKVVILGVASNWDQSKGLFDFIELSKQLSPDDYQIVLVGVDEKISKILPKNIISIFKTNSIDELKDIYSASDVFVNLTYFDNFPTVNIEALACGTPVVTYNTGGSPESISENTGSIINQGDIEQLIIEIERWGNKNKMVEFNCRGRAVKYYSKDHVYSKYIRLYENLLKTSM